MKLRISEQTLIALLLIALSAIVYLIQFSVFHDPRNTVFYLLQDPRLCPHPGFADKYADK